MDVEEIEVVIEKDGRVSVQVRGVKGPACLDLTRALEAALGGDILSREMTPEAYEAPGQSAQDQEQAHRG